MTASVVENERTGERIEFLVETEELLVMRVCWTRPGHRAVRHRHPAMEERWICGRGELAVEVEGVEHRAGPGEVVVAPAGHAHLAWNPTDGPVGLTIEMRPALRWAEFVRLLFAGTTDPGELLRTYRAEIELAPAPPDRT